MKIDIAKVLATLFSAMLVASAYGGSPRKTGWVCKPLLPYWQDSPPRRQLSLVIINEAQFLSNTQMIVNVLKRIAYSVFCGDVILSSLHFQHLLSGE